VLGRSLEEGGGLCSELSTATARWRRRGWFWARRGAWHGREDSSARQQEGEELRSDAWAPARRKRWPGRLSTATAGGAVGGGEKTEQGAGEGEKRINLQFLKIPGTSL